MPPSPAELSSESTGKRSPVLLVDDDPEILNLYEQILTLSSIEVTKRACPYEALNLLAQNQYSLMIVDLEMPGMNGLELIKTAQGLTPEMQVLVVTGHCSVESAVEAMKLGALDYIAKPFLSEELRLNVEKALSYADLASQNQRLRDELASRERQSSQLVGSSRCIAALQAKIHTVADTPATVLIRGESGVGKEVVADEIQRLSPRHDKPYLKINCGAIPEHLLEDELFGHEKGAYTGATTMRKGKFEFAD
ncbi:MAG: sigma-54-dependent transcriptional regulator, partial [Planctomycetota bacterium]